MEKLKFTLFLVVILIVIGLIGYWSVTTIQSGSEHKTSEKIKTLEEANEGLKKEVEDLADKLSVAESSLEEFIQETKEEAQKDATKPTVYKYQDLIDDLQKLVNDGIFMKVGSGGTRVGIVQKFLNIYNNTSKRVDNDYGAGTKKAIIAFQKSQGLTADGQAGSNTFKKMITWLKGKN